MKAFFGRLASLLLLLVCTAGAVSAQDTGVRGRVFDPQNKSISWAFVFAEGDSLHGVYADSLGNYRLPLAPGHYFIRYQHPKFGDGREEVDVPPGLYVIRDVKLVKVLEIGTQDIIGTRDPMNIDNPENAFTNVLPIAPEKITEIPTIKADLTSRLAFMGGGVVANNEFSSQYRVRGGNFDENLVYVNDIEIYRPFLIRSGQQEGLGFVNPNLVSEVGFSSGGFQARFGDKLSSVLDVTYKNPRKFAGTAELGVLNQNLHFEGKIQKKLAPEYEADPRLMTHRPGRVTYLVGGRRFTPQYVLNSLDTKGEYKPVFHDVQGMISYIPRQTMAVYKVRERNGMQDTIYLPTEKLKFSLLFNYADNKYQFVPTSRETSFGTIQNVFRLRVGFAGKEVTRYSTGFAALMAEHRPTLRMKLKYIFTGFSTLETEDFDIEGGYFLSDVNTNFGSEGYNDVVFDRGIGTFFQYGRNDLAAQVLAAEHRGDWYAGDSMRHKITWGVRAQNQLIQDELKEWYGVDSAGYFKLQESFRTTANLNSFVYKAFVQDHWKISRDQSKRLIVGGRVIYNDLNQQLLFAPRVQFVIDPGSRVRGQEESDYARSRERNYQLRFSAGVYHQPAFYREMRAMDGRLNTQLKAQTSYHAIAGGDYLFRIWGRPFKLYGEAYFKWMENLIPYEVDNVRIRYYPFNTAQGFAYGADARVAGEFIKDVDSWMSLGLLKTSERIDGVNDDWVRRPSDQRFTFSMYFQDELPRNPTFKASIAFFYGSGMRFGPPRVIESRTIFGVPSYQRVDLGFSKEWPLSEPRNPDAAFSFKKIILSAEVYNLFQRANTISYIWIKDVYNTQFPVPNFLSSRLLNIRMLIRF